MKSQYLAWLLLLVVAVGIPHSVLTALTARDRAAAANNQLAQCNHLATQIGGLRASSSTIASTQHSTKQIREHIKNALEQSGTKGNILRIEEREPRPIKDSPYVEQLTQIKLADVELIGLVRFLKELTATTDEYAVDAIRLSEPHARNENEAEQWGIDVVLSSLVYEPS